MCMITYTLLHIVCIFGTILVYYFLFETLHLLFVAIFENLTFLVCNAFWVGCV